MLKKVLGLTLALILMLTGANWGGNSAAAATNDYVTAGKTVNPTSITVDGEAEVTLNIKGTPPTNIVMPNDVILIIDKSGSMSNDNRISAAKSAAKGFIDLMDMSKHQVGIVDYSSGSNINLLPLSTDVNAAKAYIDTLQANGGTATGAAIDKAIEALTNHRPEAQPVIVIMTDGDANEPEKNPYQYAIDRAQAAKEAGIVFYTIALLGSKDNPDVSGPNILLKQMATTESHHHFVLGSTGLSDIYAAIVKEIGVASAYNVVVNEKVSSEFEIVPDSYINNIPQPTVNGNTLTWSFLELKDKNLQFKYKIRPKDKSKAGTFKVSSSSSEITYKDYAGANRTKAIPNASLTVTHLAPTITSVDKDFGHPNGGETVTINGEHFRPNATVMFGSKFASSVQYVNDQQLVVTAIAGTQGKTTVKVTNDDGQFATAGYTYKADPVVTSYTPNSGPYKGGTVVFFYGSYFAKGITVKFGDNAGTVNYYNSGYISATTPKATNSGPVDITLENPDGTKLVIPNGFIYDEEIIPTLSITTVTPNTGKMAGGEVVYIEGQLIDPSAKVYFGSTEVPINTYYSSSRIRVVAPASTTSGSVDITVTNPDGKSATLTGGYTYETPPVLPAPSITNVSPNSGQLKGGEIVYVDGTGFQKGLVVYVGDTEVPMDTFYTAKRFRFIAPASTAAGVVDLKVINPDSKEAILTDGYTYLAPPPKKPPSVTAVTPSSGPTTGGTIIYIDGKDIQNGVTAKIGSTDVEVTYYSTSRIRVISPASATSGPVDIILTNPDDQSVEIIGGFTYQTVTPTITNISPNNGPLAGGDIIYIDGKNFDPNMILTVDDNVVPIDQYYSSSRIRFIAPSRADAGTVSVVLTLPSGTSASTTYTYNAPPAAVAPVITAISPASGPAGGGTIVYIDGTGFNKNSVVLIGSKQVTINMFYTAKRFRIITPAGTKGIVDLQVVNPDGQVSNIVSFEYK
ncbi:IPT/TIG domain-containing protein [Paenibacillus solani]|uniref:IPT/TIG domain-containing protein n=1 Tax=Paenibacillus solani TaxID=1705565 RepID=UPI003D2D3515